MIRIAIISSGRCSPGATTGSIRTATLNVFYTLTRLRVERKRANVKDSRGSCLLWWSKFGVTGSSIGRVGSVVDGISFGIGQDEEIEVCAFKLKVTLNGKACREELLANFLV
jgi:hypothetical protein